MNFLNEIEYRMSKDDLNTFDDDCQDEYDDDSEETSKSEKYGQLRISDWISDWTL